MSRQSTRPTPLISLESIPPLEPYLTRRRRSPEDYLSQLVFASMLFERELYFCVLYGPYGPYRGTPPEAHAAAWRPFPATAAGAAWPQRAGDVPEDVNGTPARHDLFGLKPEAVEGLLSTTGRGKRHAVGALLASRFAADLGDHARALDLAQVVLDSGVARRSALSYAFESAVWLAEANPRFQGRVRSLERAVREEFGAGWMNRLTLARESHEFDVRRVAWRARAETEGERFERFLRTEDEFCEEERDRIMSALDESIVPDSLRPVLPLARRYGVGDDVCRSLFVRRATKTERADALRATRAVLDDIQAWVARFEPASYPPEVAAFFWLLDALDQMRRR